MIHLGEFYESYVYPKGICIILINTCGKSFTQQEKKSKFSPGKEKNKELVFSSFVLNENESGDVMIKHLDSDNYYVKTRFSRPQRHKVKSGVCFCGSEGGESDFWHAFTCSVDFSSPFQRRCVGKKMPQTKNRQKCRVLPFTKTAMSRVKRCIHV